MTHWCRALGLPPGLNITEAIITAGRRSRISLSPPYKKRWRTALSSVAGVSVTTTCAGRTDTGVHGYSQVIHFDDPVGRSIKAWVLGTNRHLPDDVRVHWATSVSRFPRPF